MKYTVWKLQLLEQSLYMVKHLLVALLTVLRCVDTYQLNLRELMQTIQTSHVLTVRTGLAAEALRICTIHDRQLFLIHYDISVDISNRNLGCRNQVEIIHFARIHLAFLVRQLAFAVSRVLIDNSRRHYLNIT